MYVSFHFCGDQLQEVGLYLYMSSVSHLSCSITNTCMLVAPPSGGIAVVE